MERVPAGSRFRVVMVYDVYDEEQDRKLLKHLFQAMKLLQDSYLGGSGTRGSGRVSFENINVSFRSPGYYKGEEGERKLVSGLDINSILGKFDAYFSK
jgi:CRISPR-associated protein Csm3